MQDEGGQEERDLNDKHTGTKCGAAGFRVQRRSIAIYSFHKYDWTRECPSRTPSDLCGLCVHRRR